jgi:hypothetical protein
VRVSPARIVAAVLLVLLLAAALSIDVVKTGQGNKSDEATYVMMALSAAYDHDLTYQRRDLERYTGIYRWGPDGIFLKRGKQFHLRTGGSFPFVHVVRTVDPRPDRLYFGKAFIYSVVTAPFVRLFGLNGFLVFHVLLAFLVCVCGYLFLVASRSDRASALVYTVAFVGATCVPVYLVFLTPEMFNFTLVFLAYFLWLYKEVAAEAPPILRGGATDVAAAILIGVATYSKPTHGLLMGPIVLWALGRRQIRHAIVAGLVSVVAAATLFGANALITGEFNYQGGDRRECVARFPFDGTPDAWFGARCKEMSTNDSDAPNVLTDFRNRFSHNVEYFLIGRHFGFVPYFFPGVVAIALWILSPERLRPWRVLTFLAVAGSVVVLLVFAPYTWSGGGGPSGNRYFMSLYAALFFVTPPLTSTIPGLIAFAGGALFTAKMLVDPFGAAKHPNDVTARGFARRLPVEITMANDLPIMLEGERAHSWFHDVLLYFLDEHSYNPEPPAPDGRQYLWIAGDGRADILMRSDWPIDHLTITADSPIRTTFIVSMGEGEETVPITPGKPATFAVKAAGVRDEHSFAYLFTARSTEGFTPRLLDPQSTDPRNLGVRITFKAVPAAR